MLYLDLLLPEVKDIVSSYLSPPISRPAQSSRVDLWVLPVDCSFASFRSVRLNSMKPSDESIIYTYATEDERGQLSYMKRKPYVNVVIQHHLLVMKNGGKYLGSFYDVNWNTVKVLHDSAPLWAPFM